MTDQDLLGLDEDTHATPVRPPLPILSSDESLPASAAHPAEFPVLIVEDDFLIAYDLEAALTDAGYKVVGVAASVDEALALAAESAPSIAIMDIRLAGERDGIDAALELFNVYGLRCVFASAHSDVEARRRAAAAHPLGWIEKPYSVVAVIDFLARVRGGKI